MDLFAQGAAPALALSRRHKTRRWGLLAGLAVLAGLALLSLASGSRSIAPEVVWQAVFAFDQATTST